MAKKLVIALFISFFPLFLLKSEEKDNSSFSISANSVVTTEFYNSFSNDTSWTPRLPPVIGRAILRGTVSAFSFIQIPFELYYSNRNFGTNQPFNQFGISPKVTPWLTLHGGYFSSKFSDLTFGDLRVLGAGIDIHPGNIRIASSYGTVRESRQEEMSDSVVTYTGEYKRTMFAARFGYDDNEGGYVYLNLLKSWDDTLSLKSNVITPTDNVVGSLSGGIHISKGLYCSGEFAVSATNANRGAQLIDDVKPLPFSLFVPTSSSFIDAAGKLSLVYNAFSEWNVKAETQWVGPGFTTEGYMQLPNDVLDITLSPTVRFFEGKMSLRSTVGVRLNNLRNNRMSATQRVIGTAGVSWQVQDNFGFDASYSNYGIRSKHENDTLRLQNIVQNITFTPYYQFEGLGGYNTLTGMLTIQDVDDNNLITRRLTNSSAFTTGINHVLSFVNTLNFTSSVYNTSVQNSGLTINVLSFSETIGYTFIENVFDASITLGSSSVRTVENELQLIFRFNSSYRTESLGVFSIAGGYNSYDYASVTYNPSFRELQCSLQWSTDF